MFLILNLVAAKPELQLQIVLGGLGPRSPFKRVARRILSQGSGKHRRHLVDLPASCRLRSKGLGVRWVLALLIVVIVIMIARTQSTHCETLMADGTYDRRGCQ
jgi:hypothetical protein